MSVMSSSAKRFIPISEDIILDAVKLAEREGIPLRDFIERILTEVIKAMKFRSNIIDILVNADAIEDIRRVGGVLLPSTVVYRVIESFGEKDFDDLVNEVKRIASWYGILARVKRGSSIEELKRILSLWLPDMNVDVINLGGKFKIIASAPNQPSKVTLLARHIIEELIKSLELGLVSIEHSRGLVTAVIEGGSGGE